MSHLTSFIIGLATLSLEVFLRAAFGLDLWSPPLFTIFVLWIAASQNTVGGLVIVMILGLVADGLSSGPAGAQGLTALVLVLLLPLLASRLQLNRGFGALVLGGVGALVSLLLTAVVSREMGSADVAARMGELFVPHLLTVALGAPLLFPLFDRLSKGQLQAADVDIL